MVVGSIPAMSPVGDGSWWTVWPTVVVAVALALFPGWQVARAWGIRGITGIGAAPALFLGLVGPGTVIAGALGIRWGRGDLLLGPAGWLWVAGVILGALLTRSGERSRDGARPGGAGTVLMPSALSRRDTRLVAGAVGFSGLMTVLPALIGTRGPQSPPQASDAVFHLSAVAFMRQEGDASPLGGLASMYDGAVGYYPTGWHALAVLLPGSVVVGANVLVLVTAGLIWPLGVAALLREVLGRIRSSTTAADGVVLAAGTALSGSVVSLLLLLTSTWPYALSLAVLPGALALVVRACAPGKAGPAVRAGALAMAALASIGVVTAHGAGLFNLAVLGGPVALASFMPLLTRWWRRGGAQRAALLGGAAGGVIVVAAGAWVMRSSLASVMAYPRPGGNLPETTWAVLTDHPLLATYTPWYLGNAVVTGLALLGAVSAWRTPGMRRWCAGTGLAIVLILLAAGPQWPLRALAGPWYTQRARIMPLVTIGVLVLAAWGVAEAQRRWGRGVDEAEESAEGTSAPHPDDRPQRPSWRRRAGMLARRNVPACLLLASLVLAPAWRWSLKTEILRSIHDPSRIVYGTMLSDEELALIRRAPSTLPADAVVLGNPSNGSAYLWSVAGVRVVYPSRPEPPAQDLGWLGRHLHEIGSNPRVCSILKQRGVRYYYTDSTVPDGATGGGREPLWGQALDRLPHQYLEEIDRTPDGTVTLWRITACD